MNTQHIPEEDLTLYALAALSPAEMREYRAHLNQCVQCRTALASAYSELALLGLSADPAPLPEGARQRFLDRIAAEAHLQVRPISEPPAPAPIPPTPAPEVVKVIRTRTGLFGWFGWATAAACIAIIVISAINNEQRNREMLNLEHQNADYREGLERSQQVMDLLTAKHAMQVTLTEAKQPLHPIGHAAYDSQKGALIFVASSLRPIPDSKTYELWLIPADGKAPIPAGLFRPDASGSASVVMPLLPQGVQAKAFGVTIEEAQGAETPTLPIVMSGQ